jgi:hypothetical protein
MFGKSGIEQIAEMLSEVLRNPYKFVSSLLIANAYVGGGLVTAYTMMFMSVLMCVTALTTVAAGLLPRISLRTSKALAVLTGILAVIPAILALVKGDGARQVVFAVLLLAAGVALLVPTMPAVVALFKRIISGIKFRPLNLLYIIPSLFLIGSGGYVASTLVFIIIVILIVQALRNKPAVQWWGLALVVIAITGNVASLFGFDSDAAKIKLVITVVLSLPILGIAIYDILKWRKAGNTLKWKTPELYRNPVALIVAAAVVTAAATFFVEKGIGAQSGNLGNANTESAMPDFSNFIQKFVSDKNFQLAHVKFPLESIGVTKATWKSELSGAFNAEGFINKESDNEYRYQNDSGEASFIGIFKKIDGQWYLTDAFYAVCDD